jgi:hypothetical protein
MLLLRLLLVMDACIITYCVRPCRRSCLWLLDAAREYAGLLGLHGQSLGTPEPTDGPVETTMLARSWAVTKITEQGGLDGLQGTGLNTCTGQGIIVYLIQSQ